MLSAKTLGLRTPSRISPTSGVFNFARDGDIPYPFLQERSFADRDRSWDAGWHFVRFGNTGGMKSTIERPVLLIFPGAIYEMHLRGRCSPILRVARIRRALHAIDCRSSAQGRCVHRTPCRLRSVDAGEHLCAARTSWMRSICLTKRAQPIDQVPSPHATAISPMCEGSYHCTPGRRLPVRRHAGAKINDCNCVGRTSRCSHGHRQDVAHHLARRYSRSRLA